jgi:hypothetical protein
MAKSYYHSPALPNSCLSCFTELSGHSTFLLKADIFLLIFSETALQRLEKTMQAHQLVSFSLPPSCASWVLVAPCAPSVCATSVLHVLHAHFQSVNPTSTPLSRLLVAHASNPSYSAGRGQEKSGSKPAWANSSWDPISKRPITKKDGWSGSRCRLWVQTPVPHKKNSTPLRNQKALSKQNFSKHHQYIHLPF